MPVDDPEHGARIDGYCLRLGASVDDGGNGARAPQPLRGLLARPFAVLNDELLHVHKKRSPSLVGESDYG